ncbi:crotonase/enoyl-CoA hydratase family protein [Nocardia iowensis]|uniref:crotonase/enoyl-CoA hydratase family protein n=1 Tax=Nocardia iowensis TaxID=204891 RepID=UPI001FE9C2E7|nr:crotonase/enoyl-CoA hydratase family protein [Nocardia iowensis]
MPNDNNIRYARIGAAAVVTIDRPDRRNAVDGPTAVELNQAYRRFEADDEARVMVLTGAGGAAFAAGADLKNLESFYDRVYVPEGPEGFTRLTADKPTIAAIEGWCVAGGLELALWCDLRVSARSARFGFLERRWGVPLLDGGTQRLPRIIGLGRALDLILTGRVIDAPEASAMGLVTELVDDGAALDRALQLAELIAGFPPQAMLADRQATIESAGKDLQSGFWLEARLGGVAAEEGLRGAKLFAAGAGRGAAGRDGVGHVRGTLPQVGGVAGGSGQHDRPLQRSQRERGE